MALNGFADTNAYICIGDEIVISVPEPDLSVWETQGVVYEEDYTMFALSPLVGWGFFVVGIIWTIGF